jgi:hypothetical protein
MDQSNREKKAKPKINTSPNKAMTHFLNLPNKPPRKPIKSKSTYKKP